MDISTEQYVSITTYRRSGEAVSSPVWIAPLADGSAAFTTGPDSGKVKRIRNNPAVTLRPCDLRGRVKPGVTEVAGTATVVFDAEVAPVAKAIRDKYGVMARLIDMSGGVRDAVQRLLRKPPTRQCAIVVRIEADG